MSHKPHFMSPRRRSRVIGRDPEPATSDPRAVSGEPTPSGAATLPLVGVNVLDVEAAVRREFGRLVREQGGRLSGPQERAYLEELQGIASSPPADASAPEAPGFAPDTEPPATDVAATREEREESRQEWLRDAMAVLGDLPASALAPPSETDSIEEPLSTGAAPGAAAELTEGELSRMSEMEREIELYKRRIAKLVGSLDRAEAALQEMAERGPDDVGIASVYRTVQGLAQNDRNFHLKRELLSKILEANLELQQKSSAA